jgi:exopolysaccharide biosynthesis polyprenyl glycosylphosphotransferase
VDDIIVALPWTGEQPLRQVVASLHELPSHIYICPDLAGFQPELRQPPSHFAELPVLEVAGKPLSGWDIVVKALEDYVLGVAIAIVLLPILLLIALVIRLDSPGPALFRQKRLGFNNQVFEIYKFRTMHHTPVPEGYVVAAKRADPRVTRVGRVLRRFSLDELPQIFNVLTGTMSLVGPRPHPVNQNEEFAQAIRGYFARHRVKPGITGLAQIRGLRGEADVERMKVRVQHDVAYAESWSFLLDMKILALTVVAIVIGRNAY